MKSRPGICRDNPRLRKSGRRGVFGFVAIAWSSFVTRSFILGDGDSFGVESDRERLFDGDLEGVRTTALKASGVEPASDVSSDLPSISKSASLEI